MNFTRHYNLEGLHAPFSASKSSWLRYSDDHIIEVYQNMKAKEYGTRLHAWAKEAIDLKIRQPRSKKTLYSYINDAIGYRMSTEVVLYYSDYFFGTADAICFDGKMLRIHDLKTGSKPVHIEQVIVYAALFCLEYRIDPYSINYDLRIYQNDDIIYIDCEGQDVKDVMDTIVHLNITLENNFKEE